MTRPLSLLRPDDPSVKPLQSVSNRVAGAWRGLAGGGAGAPPGALTAVADAETLLSDPSKTVLDTNNITFGNRVFVAAGESINIVGLRILTEVTPASTLNLSLWVDTVEYAREAVVPTLGEWTSVLFDTPTTVTAGQEVIASFHVVGGQYMRLTRAPDPTWLAGDVTDYQGVNSTGASTPRYPVGGIDRMYGIVDFLRG